MGSVSVHRRLVKSPPELWAEVSDPRALAQRLGEFGEIRITRVEPETTVAWEGESARGTVEIATTGWGTKVILTAETRSPEGEAPASAEEAVEPPPETAARPSQTETVALVPGHEPPAAEPGPETAEPDGADVAPETADAAPEVGDINPGALQPVPPVRRRGFFTRLFGRRQPEAAAPEPSPAVDVPVAPRRELIELPPRFAEPVNLEPAVPTPPSPVATDPVATPVSASSTAAGRAPTSSPVPAAPSAPEAPPPPAEVAPDPRTLAILNAVLDDLGAAHHRPFSRG